VNLKEQILELRAIPIHPLSYQEIANKLGCSKTYVFRVVKADRLKLKKKEDEQTSD
jgi:DNA-directed RNA polymerase specialized sigma24 family protein